MDFVGAAIRLALGQPVSPRDLQPKYQQPVCQRYLFPATGKVVAVKGLHAVSAHEGIALCEVRLAPGDEVGPVNSHPARGGVIIAIGDTREEARERAESAVAVIDIEVAAR